LPYSLGVRQTIIVIVAVLAAAAAGYSQTPAPAGPVALRFGTVVTGQGKSIKDGVIVVEKDRIKSVGSGDRAVPCDLERREDESGCPEHNHAPDRDSRIPGDSG